MTLKIDYSDEAQLMQGLPSTIAQYNIARGKRNKADVPGSSTKLVIRVKNNINQIPELDRVELTENWTEEEKIPIKTSGGKKPAAAEAPKEGEEAKDKDAAAPAEGEQPAAAEAPPAEPEEQKFEIKQRKKERTSEVSFKTVSHAIPPDLKTQFRGLEDQLMIEDRKILDLKEARYNLESFTYEMRNAVDQYGNMEHYIDPTLRQAYLDNLNVTVAWFDGDECEGATLEDYTSRLEAIKAVGVPVKMRYRFHNEWEESIREFEKYKQQAYVQMAGVAHLQEADRNLINDKIQVLETFFLELRSTLESLPKHQDTPCTLVDLENKQIALESEVNAILSKPPPPPPKKEEEKKEEQPEAAAPEQQPAAEETNNDTDMKDEQTNGAEAPAN